MTVRIISGERRGAHLRTPDGDATRPLRDRVREALFNTLRGDVRDARVLDAFAGSGAVGLEALSNGAEHAVFVEPAPPAARVIHENIAKLRYADRTLVLRGRSPDVLHKPLSIQPFTLLFLMPPYHSGLCQQVLADPGALARCAPDALAVCEVHKEETFEPPEGWTMNREKLYGITRLVYLQRSLPPSGA